MKLGNTGPVPKMAPTAALRYLERHSLVQNCIKHDPELKKAVDTLWEYVLLEKDNRE